MALSIIYRIHWNLISDFLDPVAAFTVGKLKVDGDMGKALEFANLLK